MFNSPHSTPDRVWASLLFKVASVPFLGLLLVLLASQVVSLQSYTPDESGLSNSGVFVEVTNF